MNRHIPGILAMALTVLMGAGVLPAPRYEVPYVAGLAVAYLSEFWADHVSGKPPRATVTGVRLARRIMHFDPSRSLAELELRPRPIRDSLVDALAWLRQTGRLAPMRHG